MYAVLEDLYFVSFLNQSVETDTDFTLTSSTNFVVVNFYVQTHLLHCSTHSSTQVMQRINRRYREVTAFNTRAVAHVAVVIFVI